MNRRVHRNPTLPGPTSRLSVYRSEDDDQYPAVSARLTMQGVELLRPRWRESETHHVWLDASLRHTEYPTSTDDRAMQVVNFEVKRDDAERHYVLAASSQMRVYADGHTAWDHTHRIEAIKRGEPGWRQRPKNVGTAPNRVPWVYAEYGALYDWLEEAIRTLAPPPGPRPQTLVYDIPTSELPAIVRVPARLTGEKRARLA